MARTLSAPESPLVKLVQGVARETSLLRDRGDGQSLMDQARTRVSSTREALEQMFGPTGPSAAVRADASAAQLGRIVDLPFYPSARQATTAGQGPPTPLTNPAQA